MRSISLISFIQLKLESTSLSRRLKFLIPFLLGIDYIILLYMIYDYDRFIRIFGLIVLYFIPPAGKESIIPAGIALGFPWVVICVSIIYIDLISCLFMLWNFDLICHLPFIGAKIEAIVIEKNEYLESHLWIKRFCFIGLVVFVFLPLQGSGAIGGSILGKILGIDSPRIFLAILIGTSLHSVAIGLSAYALGTYFNFNMWYITASVVFFVILLSLISLLYTRSKIK